MENNFTGVIYLITNNFDGKIYVGQTRQKRYKRRWSRHLDDLRCGSHTNEYLQRAYNKHGEECFSFSVLEKVETNLFDLNSKEFKYIKELNSTSPDIGYNLDSGGNSRIMSEETKRKIGEKNKNKNFGKKQSNETKKKKAAAVSRPVYCVELDKIFISSREAANELKLDSRRISDCLNLKIESIKGYHFKRVKNG